ncbi:tail fiber assembly protein [Morganella morganii]|uniref:tail fiber assembly protein n=1 Tax=Morganella morganii TaxID=582 RepID=UPI000DD7866C|nr:tail fiber assembly protein [Morganella morganii]
MQAYYSPGKNGFVLEMQKAAFLEKNDDDLIKVADAVYQEFTAGKAGMIMTPDPGKKQPMKWIPIPPPTKEQLVFQAESEKQLRISEASVAIAPLQDAVDLDMATQEEESALKEWKKYRVLLNRVDTSTAPDITWPVKP